MQDEFNPDPDEEYHNNDPDEEYSNNDDPMSSGGQPLEVYDRVYEDEHVDNPFVIAGCSIQPMDRGRFRVEDKHGKHLGTFFDVNDAIEHAKLKGDPADMEAMDYDTKDVPF